MDPSGAEAHGNISLQVAVMSKKNLSPPLTVKLALDLAMGALYIFCLGFRLSSELLHELAGGLLLVLFGAHIAINRSWYASLLRGAYTVRRSANAVVSMALLAAMLVLAVAGMLNSRVLLNFAELQGSMENRMLHTCAAYWGLVLAGIHMGMHWGMIEGVVKSKAGKTAATAVRLVFFCLACIGVWASFDREIGAKLFEGYGFDYWDPERPSALFYLGMTGVMALYAALAHCILRGMAKRQPQCSHIRSASKPESMRS